MRNLICLSAFQLWKYHADCDIYLIKELINSFNPDILTVILCDGKLKHCDLKENYGELGHAHEDICKSCIQSRNNSLNIINELALQEHVETRVLFLNENPTNSIESKSNGEALVLDRPYYLSEVCSYYRLDELSLTRVIKDSNALFLNLRAQSKELMDYFENNIEINSEMNCLGIVFNGRLSPHSDFIRWGLSKGFNTIVHERGRVDGIYNIRINRSALDQYEYNYFRGDYLKRWRPQLYQWIMDEIKKEYLEKGNTTSRLWKESQNNISEKKGVYSIKTGEVTILVFMSSTDEAFNDSGTLLLELQTRFIELLVGLKQELDLKIKIKPHPDTVSRIDLTCQHLIVNKLLELDDKAEILWPESNETIKEICEGCDLVFAPHSSVGIELAYNRIGFICFQDSPFADVADAQLSVGEITDMACLKLFITQYIENAQIVKKRNNTNDFVDRNLLSWLMWDAVFSGEHKFIEKRLDNALCRISKGTLREIGELAKEERLDLASFRHALICQAKNIDNYFTAYQLLKGDQNKNVRFDNTEDGLISKKKEEKITNSGSKFEVVSFKEREVSERKGQHGLVEICSLTFCIGEYTVIRNKIKLLPDEVRRFAETGLVLINGILSIDETMTRLVGWDIPNKAKRSYDLNPNYNMPYQSAMCFSGSLEIMKKILEECVYANLGKENIANEKELVTRYLKTNGIVHMKYREPLVMCCKRRDSSE